MNLHVGTASFFVLLVESYQGDISHEYPGAPMPGAAPVGLYPFNPLYETAPPNHPPPPLPGFENEYDRPPLPVPVPEPPPDDAEQPGTSSATSEVI